MPFAQTAFVNGALVVCLSVVPLAAQTKTPAPPASKPASAAPAPTRIDLAEQLKAGKLRLVNRQASVLAEKPGAITVSEKDGNGVVWVTGTDFGEGTIEVDVRGRDVQGASFVGIAFHGKDDNTYEGVYLRPFNFRATDPARHQHAVQYISLPVFDWPKLRQDFPEEFENPVDQSIEPTGWVPLRVVVDAKTIVIFAGPARALEVRKLGELQRGMVGLWVGNGSDGAFANLRITPAK